MMAVREQDDKPRILMVGFAVPDEIMDEICRVDRQPPIQTHKLVWSLIGGIEESADVAIDLVSALPICNFPTARKILAGYSRWDRGNGSWNVTIPFINVLILKHITRFISCWLFTALWLIRNRRAKHRLVLLGGLHSAHMYAVLLNCWLFRARKACFVSDPPGRSFPGETLPTRLIRRLDKLLLVKAMRLMNGLVVLARPLAEDFAPEVPTLLMEAVIRIEPAAHASETALEQGSNSGRFTVMYAGGLYEEYGVRMILDAFAQLPDPDYQLWLFGRGPIEDEVQQACQKDGRITYWGFVPNEVVVQKAREATVLVNARPSNQPFTRYSFPSKLVEYMLSARVVVSTKLPGISEEYYPHLCLLEDETHTGLATLLRKLHDRPKSDLDRIGRQAAAFVKEKKNHLAQGERVWEFLQRIAHPVHPADR